MNKSSLQCASSLYDEKSFYQAFFRDLESCRHEVIIESPYITTERMRLFHSIFRYLLSKQVKIFVITRDPREHQEGMAWQAEVEIRNFETIGVRTLLCTGNHHRKLAILDREILWEGSLNILSHRHSREIMRRLEGPTAAREMFTFLRFGQYIDS